MKRPIPDPEFAMQETTTPIFDVFMFLFIQAFLFWCLVNNFFRGFSAFLGRFAPGGVTKWVRPSASPAPPEPNSRLIHARRRKEFSSFGCE
jgi:hypothetical protein